MSAERIDLQQVLKDIASNAEVSRGAEWLKLAEEEYPDFVAKIRAAVNDPPEQVLSQIIKLHWACNLLRFEPHYSNALRYITNLQLYLRLNP